LPAGQEKWLRIFEWETGVWPNPTLHTLAYSCGHCENPVCIDACQKAGQNAIYKEDKYGAVLIDKEKCNGCRQCWVVCPYGSPQFSSDAPDAKASKCTMCIDRLEKNLSPICVMSCPQRAWDFGPLEDLVKKYGTNRQLEGMPDPSTVKPATIFRPMTPKKQLIPYDVDEVFRLWAVREGYGNKLPPVFTSKTDVTNVPEGLVFRTQLNMKPKNGAELMRLTKSEEA
jgi:anaerobic dimethyl sulfoxide reductase subunit B (iron-sulfur subunit)